MRRNTLILAAASGTLALSGALSGALSTQAATVDTGGATVLAAETYKNQATGRCLDDSDRGLRTVGCHGGTTQQWTVSGSPGARLLKSVGTGRCLDDSDRGFRTVGCHGGRTQQWNVHRWNDGTLQFRNRGTNRCADDSSAGLRTWTCWPGSDPKSRYQSWY